MDERIYEEDVVYDKNALDVEWEKHTAIYRYWSLKEVDAKEEKDKAVRALAVTKATIDADIRSNPSKHKIEKITEAAISSAIILSKEVEAAEQKVILMTKNLGIMASAVEAIGGQRKAALHDLTGLWSAGYYSSGGVPTAMREKISENKSEKIRKRLEK